MSLSDCPKCWDTPCTCGHQYKFMQVERVQDIWNAVTKHLIVRTGEDTIHWNARVMHAALDALLREVESEKP